MTDLYYTVGRFLHEIIREFDKFMKQYHIQNSATIGNTVELAENLQGIVCFELKHNKADFACDELELAEVCDSLIYEFDGFLAFQNIQINRTETGTTSSQDDYNCNCVICGTLYTDLENTIMPIIKEYFS